MKIHGVEIPKELEGEAKAVLHRSMRRIVTWSVITALVIVLVAAVAGWFWRNAAGVQLLCILVIVLATIVLLPRLSRKGIAEVCALLHKHGYCACGYKGMESPTPGQFTCTECGRAWQVPSTLQATANNPQ